MKKTIPILALAALITGCAAPAAISGPVVEYQTTDCEGKKSHDLTISYGDSFINVTPKVKAKQDERLVIKLDPDKKSDLNVDYETLVIHIVAKDNKSNWINRSIAANDTDQNKFHFCTAGIPAGMYSYQVIVPSVGIIDPRVEIEL